MSLLDEIKRVEKEEAKLAKRKKALEARLKEEEEKNQKLDTIVEDSGYATPKALVKALVDRFSLRAPRGSGISTTAGGNGRRKRTRVTAELRDEIKAEIKGGSSMNQVSKARGISYAVIAKIAKGGYDKI